MSGMELGIALVIGGLATLIVLGLFLLSGHWDPINRRWDWWP